MKLLLTTASLALAGVLIAPVLVAQDADIDRGHPKEMVKDSVITTKIKSKLAAEHLTSVAKIHVDTDASGVVWLTGTAGSEEAVRRAESLARETEGVRGVKSSLTVRHDD